MAFLGQDPVDVYLGGVGMRRPIEHGDAAVVRANGRPFLELVRRNDGDRQALLDGDGHLTGIDEQAQGIGPLRHPVDQLPLVGAELDVARREQLLHVR